MKKTNCFRWFLIIGIGIVFTATGCTRSINVSYKMDDDVAGNSNIAGPYIWAGESLKNVTIGVAKFDDLHSWVKKNEPESESYIGKTGKITWGLTYEGKKYSAVKDIMQKVLVAEFKNAGFNAKPIDMVLSKKNKQDFQMVGKNNGVDYIIGGDIVNFEFEWKNKLIYALVEDRISLDIIMVKTQGGEALLDNNRFTESDSEKDYIGGNNTALLGAYQLVNKELKKIVRRVIRQVSLGLYKDIKTLSLEDILLLKRAGISNEEILEIQKK